MEKKTPTVCQPFEKEKADVTKGDKLKKQKIGKAKKKINRTHTDSGCSSNCK